MVKTIVTVIALLALGVAVWAYLRPQETMVLENAFVSGRVIRLLATRDGYIRDVNVAKSETFAANQVLLAYEDVPVDLAIERHIELLRSSLQQELMLCYSLREAQAKHERFVAERDYSKVRSQRSRQLSANALMSPEEADDRNHTYTLAEHAVEVSRLQVERLRALNRLPILERPGVKSVEAGLRDRLYDKSILRIALPFSGYVYLSQVYPGKYVQEGELLLVLVPDEELAIEANVIESKLEHLTPGRPALVTLDSQPDAPLKGVIQSVVPSTARTFSNLPRNNTDSNWIKVAQRVPVLIVLDHDSVRTRAGPLPIGASARVAVDLIADAKPVPAPLSRPSVAPPEVLNVPAEERIVETVASEFLVAMQDSGCILSPRMTEHHADSSH